MSACPPREEIAAYLDGGAAPEVRGRIEQHLDGCPACRAFCEEQGLGGALFQRVKNAAIATTVLQPEKAGSDSAHLRRIGQYHLKRAIASGGMGTVYEAVQEQPRRVVALKVMRAGIASKSALRRFRYESQILARLRHPNIAQVYEAGTHVAPDLGAERPGEGVPFFAMEYIPNARAITDYAREKKLETMERLRLFGQVTTAVHHGHQKGIIHRDLKPGNILVDSDGQAKIIDFGVARATDSDMAVTTLQTDVGQLLGTLQYMSPEQFDADPQALDVRSDIYALGVVLYELLCEQLPYNMSGAAIPEAARIIREQPPTRLSSVSRMLRGDIETITLKALEKDRTRRYQSADELGAEILRYLEGEPIYARPASVWYRLRKRARKQRSRIAVVFAVTLAALIAVFSQVEKRRAVGALELELSFLRQLAVAGGSSRNQRDTQEILRLDEFAERHPEYLKGRVRLAFLLKRQKRYNEAIKTAHAILNDFPNAGAAHVLLSQLSRDSDPERAEHHRSEGRRLLPKNEFYVALSLGPGQSTEAVEMLSRVLENDANDFDARWERAWRYFELGRWQDMLADAEILVGTHPNLATAWSLQGIALSRLLRLDEAIESYDRAIEIDPNDGHAYVDRADTLANVNRLEEAQRDCNRAIELDSNLTDAYLVRGRALFLNKAFAAALSDFDHALELDPTSANALRYRGRILAALGQIEDALASYDKAIGLAPSHFPAISERHVLLQDQGRWQEACAPWDRYIQLVGGNPLAYYYRGLCRMHVEGLDRAMEDFDRALELDDKLAFVYFARARLRRLTGQYEAALADHEKSIELAPNSYSSYISWGTTLRFMGKDEEALKVIEKAIELFPQHSADLHLSIWEVRMSQGRADDAAAALATASAGATIPSQRLQIDYLLGGLSTEQLLGSALTSEEACAAHYIAGVKALHDERPEQAKVHFNKCSEQNQIEYLEYDLALWRLGKIRRATRSSPEIDDE